jgi:hypothetical protein
MSEATTIVVGTPPEALNTQVAIMVDLAESYQVTCPELREALGLDLQRNKSLQATIEGERVKITKPLNEALRNVNALFKKLLGPLESAEARMKREALRWDDEQARIKREAQEAAARKADDERRRLEAEAAKQKKAGNVETAHAIASAAQMIAPIPVEAPPIVKVAGESTRELWHAEIDDLRELCRAIGAGEVSTENVLPNMPTLNSQARSLKGTMRIPGVRAVSEKVLGTRAA